MSQKKYIGKKIRELREGKLHISAEKLGEMLTSPKSGKAILSWERGRTQPDADALIDLCVIFGVDISYFYEKTPEYQYALIHINDEIDNDREFVEVPLYGSIAAGTPIEMIETNESFAIPSIMHEKYPNAFLLKVKGESMNRKIPNGSYALIDPTKEVINGKVYAVCVNGFDATIKRVRKLNNGFELIPDSIDPTFKTKVYDYGEPETEEITVLGRVVWYCIPFDYEI